MAERKLVRAVRTGFWEGHRRRKGAEFTVDANAKEVWFVDVGAAPAGDKAPAQLTDARGPQRRTFVGAMEQIGRLDLPPAAAPVQAAVPEAPAPIPVLEAPVLGGAGDDLTS